jgi:hypothetical protein
MRTFTISIWFFALSSCLLVCSCSRAEGLVGVWRTEMARVSPAGDTNNMVEAYETVEFSEDGAFKLTGVMKGQDGKEVAVPMSGTYTIVDTNRVRLEIAPNSARPDMKIPLTVSFTISGDQLEMGALTVSVVPEKKKYRRLKR